jgi:enoyl-CoA hydratase
MNCLKFERREDGVGLLSLSRPKKLNALNAELISELDVILAELDVGPPLVALVLTGEGGRAFAAGADIAEMAEYSVQQATDMAKRGQRVLARLESFHAPTIAAVSGFALGGGCELAMCCDLILAGATAVFGQPEVKLGVIPGFGGTQRLPRLGMLLQLGGAVVVSSSSRRRGHVRSTPSPWSRRSRSSSASRWANASSRGQGGGSGRRGGCHAPHPLSVDI